MNPDSSAPRHALRLWPGVVAAALQWLGWAVIPVLAPEWAGTGFVMAAVFSLAVVVWWLFFSRVPWSERLGAIVLMVVAVAATSRVVDASIANGMMGAMLPIYSIPALSLALVASLVATVTAPAAPGACRWWSPSCWPAARSRSCGPAA